MAIITGTFIEDLHEKSKKSVAYDEDFVFKHLSCSSAIFHHCASSVNLAARDKQCGFLILIVIYTNLTIRCRDMLEKPP